jgi:hypothetical protein
MQSSRKANLVRTAATLFILGGAVLSSHAASWTLSGQSAGKPVLQGAARSAGTSAVRAVAAIAAVKSASPMKTAKAPNDLRAKIRWIPVRQGAKTLRTLDEASRLMLARSAAQSAGLESVGLSYHDVYGVIEAETSWVPRDGMGKNGVTSMGLAQFEPATAKGLGLQDPNDPVQAVHAAAVYMKHGAEWASRKIAHLKLSPQERAAKLREGVSIYYNLSVRGRNKWDGINTAALPIETQRHISNVRSGVQEALQLSQRISA